MTLRQSEIGFEVFGPRVAGAKTRADLQVDLAGGFAQDVNGIDSGLMRLRTATMRMDWENTSVVVGQDGIFFSPNSPTSFATLAQPALSYAGNLWGWVPQIRVEHRMALGEKSSLLLQGGILDPVSGEVPGSSTYRQAGPGEASRQPAYGTRVAWTRNVFGQPLRLGVGGYYGRQNYGFDRRVDAWAAMSDVELPLGSKFALSGKVYRGRALGGLYGGLGQSVLFSGNNTGVPYTEVIALNSVGGWAQLKYRPTTKLEFNVAFGMDNPYAKDLEYFPYPLSYGDPTLWRNRAGFANVIYRPRSDLLFSAEYRRIETDSLVNGLNGARAFQSYDGRVVLTGKSVSASEHAMKHRNLMYVADVVGLCAAGVGARKPRPCAGASRLTGEAKSGETKAVATGGKSARARHGRFRTLYSG